jgi:hypothetical protein
LRSYIDDFTEVGNLPKQTNSIDHMVDNLKVKISNQLKKPDPGKNIKISQLLTDSNL